MIAALALSWSLSTTHSYAWYEHKYLMPLVLAPLKQELSHQLTPPPAAHSQGILKSLARELGLNSTHLPPISVRPTTAEALLTQAIDEPDLGMDQDLPDAWDLHDERHWMGGRTGGSSQGFRHMFFGGWRATAPLASFQIPFRAIGRSPQRVELLLTAAKDLRNKGETYWSFRVLGWALHYVQDLTQPFHAAQVPYLGLVPWYHLSHWPWSESVKTFVPETTRIIGNYHLAYEGYLRALLMRGPKTTVHWEHCFNPPADAAWEVTIGPSHKPMDLALAIARNSASLAWDLGKALAPFFGPEIRREGLWIIKNPDVINNAQIFSDPAVAAPRQIVHDLTCRAWGMTSSASRTLISDFLKP